MFSTWLVGVLRLIHIVFGVFWVGGIFFFTWFLLPTAQTLGPAAGPVMDHLTRVRKMPSGLLHAAWASVISGFALFWHDSAGFQGPWMASRMGMVLGTGGVLALVAIGIGLTVNVPTLKRVGALAAEIQAKGAPTPEQAVEMQRLQRRLGIAVRAVALLLLLTLSSMALARYV